MQNDSNSCPVYIPANDTLAYDNCHHCGTPVKRSKISEQNNLTFCCKGCEFIYRTLNGLGLQNYYKFLSTSQIKAGQGLGAERRSFLHFDDPEVSLSWIEKLSSDCSRVSFYLPTIHCAACIWLLEKLPSILKGVYSANVNFTQGKIEITYNPALIILSEIAQTLNSLGYAPVPASDFKREQYDRKLNRTTLLRIGVAGFCAANTMMLSVSIFQSFYSGIEPQYANLLRWLSALIALPAVTYSAIPFYRTAIATLLTGALHIDLPIAAAIIIAYLAGVYACINADPFVYFDSITTLIFLLLVGRYIQSKAISKARASTTSAWDLMSVNIRVIENSKEIIKPLKELVIGDELKILPAERIPADGVVIEGDSSIDLSFLTGESIPQSVSKSSEVFGGAINLESELIIKVSKSATDSRIGRILTGIDRQQAVRTKAEDRANLLSSYFVAGVLSLSVVAYFAWQYIDPAKSFDIVIAVLIVTCPCALGLAIPAAVSIAMARAKKIGIFIGRSDAFEAISEAENFYFDKTRTLTSGVLQIEKYFISGDANPEILFSLSQSGSSHPVASALSKFCADAYTSISSSLDFKIRHFPGRGMQCTDNTLTVWRIGSLKWASELQISANEEQQKIIEDWQNLGYSVNLYSRNMEICGIFALSDTLCAESEQVISFLKSKGKNVFMLSGDSNAAVSKAAKAIGIPAENAIGELLPEQKLQLISGKSCMIGDGLNDAQGMKGSFVSIGLRGGIEATIEVASIFIGSGRLSDLLSLLRASFLTSRIIKLNLAYAVFYNILGGTLALTGHINPLLAAFIMPASSITIIIHSLLNKSFK